LTLTTGWGVGLETPLLVEAEYLILVKQHWPERDPYKRQKTDQQDVARSMGRPAVVVGEQEGRFLLGRPA
jgi:hypothetical protein